MLARGEDRTDWARANAMTEEELEASIAADPDERDLVWDLSTPVLGPPLQKAVMNMRVDKFVLDYFKKSGRGYQTRINAVLRAYVLAQPPASAKPATAKPVKAKPAKPARPARPSKHERRGRKAVAAE
jgi:uncharacterized protein (DUF4415 family)